MPSFLHLFKEELDEKQECMRKILHQGYSNELDEDFNTKFKENWWELPSNEKKVKSFAVDSSRALRNYANGSSVYITRALALGKDGEKSKIVRTNAFVSRGNKQQIRGFIRLKSEHTEHEVALKELRKREYDALLLDGSLFGRMMHLPADQPIQEDFMLDYKETLNELIHTCKRKDVLLLGISKDSAASFLRDKILADLFEKELSKLKENLPISKFQEIKEKWKKIDETPNEAMDTIRDIHETYPEKTDRMFQLFTEALSSRVDFSLIGRFREEAGYTTPIELGPATLNFQHKFKKMQERPDAYLRKNFRNSLARIEDDAHFLKRGREILQEMCNLPTVISFHILLNKRDSPMRVDLPAYEVEGEKANTLGECVATNSYEGNRERIREVVRILKSGYVGLNTYNVLLKQVDRAVKLKKKEVDTIYEKVLRDFFELPLEHTRRFRRVRPF